MTYTYSIVGMQIQGQRDTQEDNYIIFSVDEQGTQLRAAPTLVVMADGMGGHAAGDIASRIAVDSFTDYFADHYPEYQTQKMGELLKNSLDSSNHDIGEAAKGNTRQGMGCTLVGAFFKQQYLWWVSVGDSHLYLIHNNQIMKKNEDHSYGAYIKHLQAQGKEVVNEGDQNSNVLLSALDGSPIERVDLPQAPLELELGDRILIASDGLNTLRLGTVLQLSEIYEDTQQFVEMLLREIEVVNDPKQDNTTIIVLDVRPAEETVVVVADEAVLEKKQQRTSIGVAIMTVILMLGVGWWFVQPKSRVIEVVDDQDPLINESGQIVLEAPVSPAEIPSTVSIATTANPVLPVLPATTSVVVLAPVTTIVPPISPPVSPGAVVSAPAPSPTPPGIWQRFKQWFAGDTSSIPQPIQAPRVNLPAVDSTVIDAIKPVNAPPATVATVERRQPAVFQQKKFRKTLANGQPGPLMISIANGEFLMGTLNVLPYFDERPQHKVTLTAFAMSVYEITVAEYRQFSQATGYPMPTLRWQAANDPMTMVSWDDAQAYTKWLSQQTGRGYRLPTEAEWEYAARAGTTQRFWWGSEIGVGNARCFGCEAVVDPGGPAVVDSYPPNPFGLYHVVGNVMEWVLDCYAPDYTNTPRQGHQAFQMPQCESYAVRGGSFASPALRSLTKRNRLHRSTRRDDLGFRVVQELVHSR